MPLSLMMKIKWKIGKRNNKKNWQLCQNIHVTATPKSIALTVLWVTHSLPAPTTTTHSYNNNNNNTYASDKIRFYYYYHDLSS